MDKQLKIWVILIVTMASSFTLAEPAPPLLYKVASNLCIVDGVTLGDDGFFYTIAGTTCGSGGVTAFNPSTGSLVWGPIIPPGCSGSFGGNGASVGSNNLIYAVGDWNQCGNGR